jgi:hypothetical protein
VQDVHILKAIFNGRSELFWLRLNPALVHPREYLRYLAKLGRVTKALLHLLLHPRGECLPLLHAGFAKHLCAAQCVCEHCVLESGRSATEDEFRKQNASPRVAKDIKIVVNLQVLNEVDKLVYEEIHGPESCELVLCRGRTSAANLVVENDWTAKSGKIPKRNEIVVRERRTAVENDERPLTSTLKCSNDLVVGVERFAIDDEWDGSLDDADDSHVVLVLQI